jgi:ribosome silencing factor RsfS/YbeB/iojap
MLRRNLNSFQRIIANRYIHTTTRLRKDGEDKKKESDEISSSVSTRFQVFQNENVGIIFDIEEERAKRRIAEETGVEEEVESIKPLQPILQSINLERKLIIFNQMQILRIFLDGKTGVYDIEDLVDVLRKENAIDLCVIKIPKEYSYVDYMCIVTGSSYRHMLGMASFVRKIFKAKRHESDSIPKIEGKESKDWMAMDLGNIALHIFSKSARNHYNLEILWTLGSEYEKRSSSIERKEELYQEFMSMKRHNEGDNEINRVESKT